MHSLNYDINYIIDIKYSHIIIILIKNILLEDKSLQDAQKKLEEEKLALKEKQHKEEMEMTIKVKDLNSKIMDLKE